MNRLAILILTATVSVPALACSPPEPTRFEDIAPGARNILVFRIESLELEPASSDAWELHRIKGKIRVLRKYRESGDDFQWLTYINTVCQGRRLDVGGIYLIATNSSPPLSSWRRRSRYIGAIRCVPFQSGLPFARQPHDQSTPCSLERQW